MNAFINGRFHWMNEPFPEWMLPPQHPPGLGAKNVGLNSSMHIKTLLAASEGEQH